SGKTTSSLTLNNMLASDSGNYTVVVGNSFGSVTSSIVPLTVLAGPPILSKVPVSTARFAGGAVTFTGSALGSTPITYQWLKGGVPIAGATGTSYTIQQLQPSDLGNYAIVATNPHGQTNSPAATLSFLPVTPNSVGAIL